MNDDFTYIELINGALDPALETLCNCCQLQECKFCEGSRCEQTAKEYIDEQLDLSVQIVKLMSKMTVTIKE